MAEPLHEFKKGESELQKSLARIQELAEDQFIIVRQIRDLHASFQKKKLVLEKELIAAEKPVRRKTFRLLRKAGRIQRHLAKTASQAIKDLHHLETMLPARAASLINIPPSRSEIETYSNTLLRYLSRKEGALLATARAGSEPEIISAAHTIVEEAIRPLLAAVRLLQQSLGKHRTDLEVAVVAEHSIHLDLDAVSRQVKGSGEPIILLDADFAAVLEKQRRNAGKMYFEITLRKGSIQIPRQVYREMTFRPRWSAGGLTTKKLADYLKGKLHAEVIQIEPRPPEQDKIVRYWKTTAKGQRAGPEEEEKFRRSGDMELLAYAQRHSAQRPIIILSNDHDVISTARLLPGKVEVYSYAQGSLVRAH